ncbi:MAG TPA: LamG domain-containing protein, partial [Anaerolineales bacterium]|nr:LamG domain-containing protein [Anaerolineales bacterium]
MALFYGKFDANAYYEANPEVKQEGINAEQHWALHGIAQDCPGYIVGVPLGGQFDPTGYLNCNPDVRNAGTDAKEHYKDCGWMEGRDICLWVDAVFEPSGTWLHLAKQGETFSVTGPKIVRYGAATQWVTKEISGSGQCTVEFFGIDPAFGVLKNCQVLVSGPKPGVTWSRIGAEGENITLDGTRTVRYGAGTQWIMKLLSGSVECTSAFFGGDPAPNLPKVCEVLEPDEMRGTWQRIAVEGQRFSIIGAQTIRYGEGQQWITKVLAGLGECTNAAFGGDPAPERVKSCEAWTPALEVSPIAVLDFDGQDDYVEVCDANTLLDVFTIEAWVKPDKMRGGILLWGNQKGQSIALRLSDHGISFRYLSSDLQVIKRNLVGKWHHVAVTRDGTYRYIFLDGQQVGTDKRPDKPKRTGKPGKAKGAYPAAKSPSQAMRTQVDERGSDKHPEPDFRMGHYRRIPAQKLLAERVNFQLGLTYNANYFDGNLAEIRIWDRARSQDEIKDDMAHRLVGDEPGLIAYWRLNNRGETNERIQGATWLFDDNLEHVIDPAYYYRLTTMWQGDGRSLHILNDGRNNLPVLAGTGDYASQYWRLIPLGKNYYRLTNRWLGPQKSFDIVNDGANNNRPIMADSGAYS